MVKQTIVFADSVKLFYSHSVHSSRLLAGITDCAHKEQLSQAQAKLCISLSGKLHSRIPWTINEPHLPYKTAMYTNGAGTPSWMKSLLVCEKERILTTATKTHAVLWGICHGRSFEERIFLLKMGRAIKAEITEPRQQSSLPQGGSRYHACWFLSTMAYARHVVETKSSKRPLSTL